MFLTVLITLVCMLIHLQPLVLINVLNTLISMLIHYPNHASWSVLTAITPTMSLVRVFRTAPHRTSQMQRKLCQSYYQWKFKTILSRQCHNELRPTMPTISLKILRLKLHQHLHVKLSYKLLRRQRYQNLHGRMHLPNPQIHLEG